MNIVDKVIQEWSWRCKKGYPDLDSKEDLTILKEVFSVDLFEAKKPFEHLSQQAQSVADQLIKTLGIPKDEIKADTRNRIVILTDRSRSDIFSKLEGLGFERDTTMTGSSAGGYRTDDGVEIIHKPLSLNLRGGAGIKNEVIFVDLINEALEQETPLTVKITPSEGKTLIYSNVTEVNHIGKIGESKGWKGDVALKTEKGQEHISIKKDGPYRWESVMTRYPEIYRTFMEKAINGQIPNLELVQDQENPRLLKMIDPVTSKPYGRIFITDHPDVSSKETVEAMAFGNDNADVVQKTFTEGDFKLDRNILHIKSTRNITSYEELEEEDLPILEFERNASKATKTEGIYGRGIVMRTSPKKVLTKASSKANHLLLSVKDLE